MENWTGHGLMALDLAQSTETCACTTLIRTSSWELWVLNRRYSVCHNRGSGCILSRPSVGTIPPVLSEYRLQSTEESPVHGVGDTSIPYVLRRQVSIIGNQVA